VNNIIIRIYTSHNRYTAATADVYHIIFFVYTAHVPTRILNVSSMSYYIRAVLQSTSARPRAAAAAAAAGLMRRF